jgi:hypothetical protein
MLHTTAVDIPDRMSLALEAKIRLSELSEKKLRRISGFSKDACELCEVSCMSMKVRTGTIARSEVN